MKLLGPATVKISSLLLPGDWKDRIADPRLKAAAADLEKTPLLQRPGLMRDRRTIIWGRDRIAVSHLAGQKTVDVDIWDCTEDEADRAELVENIRRHDDQDEIKARLVALEVRIARAAKGDSIATKCCDTDSRQPDRREKAAARKAVAETLQTTPAAIKQAELRSGWGEEEPEEPSAADPSIETWGVNLGAEVLSTAALVQGYIDKLDAQFRRLVMVITEGQENLPEEWSRRLELQRLRLLLRDTASAVRTRRPEALCPVCKRVPQFLPNCAMCGGTGLASTDEVKRAPKETTKRGGKAGIFVGPGDFRAVDDVGGDDEPEAA